MIWLLLGLLLLVSLVALALCLLTLWRRVKVLGRSVAEAGGAVAEATATIEARTHGGPLDRRPCPTCGAPASAATKPPSDVHRGVPSQA